MALPIGLTYLFDPLCGWCYGASLAIQQLSADPAFDLELAPVGLFAGEGARPMNADFAAYAWANDQRIARLTGLPFSEAYRYHVLGNHAGLFDSAPVTLALTAVRLTEPEREREALKAFQEARYVEGLDTTLPPVLAGVLEKLKLELAARRSLEPDGPLVAAYHERVSAARQQMRKFGLEGVPALLVTGKNGARPVQSDVLFGAFEGLIETLKAIHSALGGATQYADAQKLSGN